MTLGLRILTCPKCLLLARMEELKIHNWCCCFVRTNLSIPSSQRTYLLRLFGAINSLIILYKRYCYFKFAHDEPCLCTSFVGWAAGFVIPCCDPEANSSLLLHKRETVPSISPTYKPTHVRGGFENRIFGFNGCLLWLVSRHHHHKQQQPRSGLR